MSRVCLCVWEKRVRSIPPEEMSMYVCVRVCVLVVSSFWGKEEQGGVVLVRWFCWLSLMLLRKLAQAVTVRTQKRSPLLTSNRKKKKKKGPTQTQNRSTEQIPHPKKINTEKTHTPTHTQNLLTNGNEANNFRTETGTRV